MDTDTYQDLVVRHKNLVHGYAYRMLGNQEDARDVAQEVLIRLWENRDKVIPDSSKAWLLRTTYRLCVDRTRRKKVRSEVFGDTVLDPVADVTPGPEKLSTAGELGRAIEAALGRLRKEDRTVVLLREVHQTSYEEIARILSQPLGTVKARLHRARIRLRRELVEAGVTP
jgi:RNA polymerase sigma-70 factor (ECF subfamily)